MIRRLASACAILVAGLLLGSPAETRQSAPEPSPWTGAPGVRRLVSEIMAAQATSNSAPRRSKPFHRLPDRSGLKQAPDAPATAQWPPLNPASKTMSPVPMSPQTVGVNFLGAQLSESGFIPPDSMGAVGPTQFLVVVNGRIKVFDKNGGLGPLNVDLDTFFASVLPAAISTSDPRVRFDRLSGRWFISCISVDLDPTHVVQPPNRILLAVSSGPAITSAASFTFFFFQQDLVGATPNSDTDGFADYDTMGIDANAVYIGANMFDKTGPFLGTTGWVIRKSSLTGGGPIVVTAFRQLWDGTSTPTSAGPDTPQGADNDDPAATEGYFIGVDGAKFSKLQLRRVSDPGGTPTISGNLTLGVSTTRSPIPVAALGSTIPLDALTDRLMMAQIKNGSLWTVHNINVDSTGVAVFTGGTTGRNGARWYEIINLATTPTLKQLGTLFDPTVVTSGTARHTWMPSLAVSGQGHMALGHSIAADSNSAGTQIQPSAGAGGRLATDALGTIQPTTIFAAGAGNYNAETGVVTQRWGDFSFTSVDPTDNMTMWTVQEYCNATDSWGVRVAKLIAPPPAGPTSASPSTGSQGTSSILVTITGTSTAGSGFYDPGAPFPNRLTASATGGITVNGVTFTDPTHATVDLNIPLGATLGAQSITLTNPDGQAATLAAGFTVTSYVPATVTSVNSTSPDGTYGVGAIIPINVTFSAPVTVTGTPQLTLETGAVDEVLNVTGGSGTATLTFGYPVAAGDASADLDYVSAAALSLNGGTIKDALGVDVVLTLPSPGTVGSLAANRDLVIDTTPVPPPVGGGGHHHHCGLLGLEALLVLAIARRRRA